VSNTLDHPNGHKVRTLESVVIRFAGDSGDGMQVTGDRFTAESAVFGNDLATLPNFPAEIRAPAGTLSGVSVFQVQIAAHEILTPGDEPNVLVAMNPAALATNVADLAKGGTLIVNSDAFDTRSLEKAGYAANPLTDGSLAGFRVYEIPMTSLTLKACAPTHAKPRDAERSKNFFALGIISWLYNRPTDTTLSWIASRYAAKPVVVEANTLAFRAGYNFGETAELFDSAYEVPASELGPGEYTNISGNTALAWGLVAASQLAGLRLFLGAYPITPASDLLHELAKQKHFGIVAFQAEDEIAAAGAALGASFGGSLGVTTTSGPGIDLMAETIGLAVALELPLVVVDVQRGGPSTGLPTRTEQSDLLCALYGRHGEAPLPVVAARTPGHCFAAAIEAARLALKYRTPVFLLSDGYLANGSEPWRVPDLGDLPAIGVEFATAANHVDADGSASFWPYARDPVTLARAWAVPGTAGLEHRLGGIEKAEGSGEVSYDPDNHARMVQLRAAKVAGIAADIAPVELDDPDGAELLVLGWGSTYGACAAAVKRVRARGSAVAQAHLVHLNPFPANLGEVLGRYRRVLIPENNLGQLASLVRARYLVDAVAVSAVRGTPFRIAEVERAVVDELERLGR
jgi:2-oxoglutarate ferredoxin oxidoreductase subunit alpha